MHLKQLVWLTVISVTFLNCKEDKKEELVEDLAVVEEVEERYEFGFNLDNFIVKRDTIRRGESFGEILERNNIGYPKIFQIAEKVKDTFDIRTLRFGKPYTLLCSKDSLETPKSFIYQPNKEEYVVIDFQDSIQTYMGRKPIKYVEKEASGVITPGSGISVVLDKKGLSQRLANKMANEIYAWTIDFNRLQPGDRFKVIYTDKYIDDSTYAGVHDVKAAYFEHNKKPFYAFEFETDSVKGIIDYFNEDAKNLRRAFLKSPLRFGRVSSRYNLRRRIAHYGYRVKAHRGTDFAAPNGTPILATASGTVTKSSYTRGNGKYVKIRHNSTYETQYLHMSRRKAKVGEFVKQGDVIGYVGNTGSSAGNHVCYRFWKNGKQVDPFKEKLPEAKPISDSLKVKFLDYIAPIKQQLDNIILVEDSLQPETEETLSEIQ
ncbi:peptidoglycan DD-metalloendopeptidase family protein [Winogradskyella jejuensis]|uniref:Murein DD-endopeptidase MepM and murein hydrolase activator NlpD, contain LysM domain n=1 Tax=Winogradskyella jejuensis TaxID=1089305 RepID=A0A1M5M0P1_9FLAO|nr:peptidoglycan DD-metalloendopeptidase family protein [Winogradskyella jejuensis]SHG70851.1 Murein DD-endopeptidase MepM and murein hydrolase activator NlpD, contain LysM domain [Winogradskyella jejuensis]